MVSMGKIYAICDHCEKSFGVPVSAKVLKEVAEVSRTEIRKLVRMGKLEEYDITETNGQRRKGYARPQVQQ